MGPSRCGRCLPIYQSPFYIPIYLIFILLQKANLTNIVSDHTPFLQKFPFRSIAKSALGSNIIAELHQSCCPCLASASRLSVPCRIAKRLRMRLFAPVVHSRLCKAMCFVCCAKPVARSEHIAPPQDLGCWRKLWRCQILEALRFHPHPPTPGWVLDGVGMPDSWPILSTLSHFVSPNKMHSLPYIYVTQPILCSAAADVKHDSSESALRFTRSCEYFVCSAIQRDPSVS